jgi:hypothetical protein
LDLRVGTIIRVEGWDRIMKPLWAAVGGLVLVGTAGAVAVALPQGEEEAVQQLATATPAETGATPDPLYEGLEKIIEDQKKPPFIGDKLGIYIVGTPDQEVDVPAQYVTAEEICPNGSSVMSWDQAGALALSLELPPEYVFLPDDPDTGAFACNDVVQIAKRAYGRDGIRKVLIARTRITVRDTLHWPADRVKVVTIGGREAVLLEPVHPEGSEHGGTSTEILFPEPFGMTYIHTNDLTLAETLRLGEILVEATDDDTSAGSGAPVSAN